MTVTHRRDRHGRGPRGLVLPPHLPGYRTRAQVFDELLLEAMERLDRRWSTQLDRVEFAVENVPPSDPAPWEHGEMPLGRLFPADGALPTRIVLYRRPLETRAQGDLPRLVFEVVVEQVAQLLGLPPQEIDPGYDPDG